MPYRILIVDFEAVSVKIAALVELIVRISIALMMLVVGIGVGEGVIVGVPGRVVGIREGSVVGVGDGVISRGSWYRYEEVMKSRLFGCPGQ